MTWEYHYSRVMMAITTMPQPYKNGLLGLTVVHLVLLYALMLGAWLYMQYKDMTMDDFFFYLEVSKKAKVESEIDNEPDYDENDLIQGKELIKESSLESEHSGDSDLTNYYFLPAELLIQKLSYE
ncbi:uncharacterized protein LOC106672514 [Cimex lectularius]|uniref:Uncharacterized protein n=1 Tax=Cimex lectularius TaxID=79782 RepID=A0A8I6S9W5_CIMLE|nr:uncharacterized protein LOC106672514 [Cimex lectularius]